MDTGDVGRLCIRECEVIGREDWEFLQLVAWLDFNGRIWLLSVLQTVEALVDEGRDKDALELLAFIQSQAATFGRTTH